MKNTFLAFTVTVGIAFIAGCGGSTTAAEIDRIMAEARNDAAKDLAHARNGFGGNAIGARKDAVSVSTLADLKSDH